MLVKEFDIGAAHVKIYDDYVIKDPVELEAAKKRIADIMYNALRNQHLAELAKKEQDKETTA